jgi:hypothetical protein
VGVTQPGAAVPHLGRGAGGGCATFGEGSRGRLCHIVRDENGIREVLAGLRCYWWVWNYVILGGWDV